MVTPDPAVEIGVALMTLRGVPEHVARQAMYEDPTCRRIAQQLVPPIERLVRHLNALAPRLAEFAQTEPYRTVDEETPND